MAEKPKKKSGGKYDTTFLIIVVVIIILVLVFSSFSKDSQYFQNEISKFLHETLHISTVGNILKIVMFAYSVFFTLLIAYCGVRLLEIREREQEHLKHEIAEYAHHQAEKQRKLEEGKSSPRNDKWNAIIAHLLSSNPADWKLAILEADEMLDTLVGQLGFQGDSLGEKLKSVDRDKFRGLNPAWEVHLVRNRIAHEGSNFDLSEREAKRTIALYEQIFKEFNYI
jgi:preprotein translocase subunit SecG